MKKPFALFAFGASAVACLAQGTTQFYADLSGETEIPPNQSPWTGTAGFVLNGTTLDYSVQTGSVPVNAPATINGPGLEGPSLFTLQGPTAIYNTQTGMGSLVWGQATFDLNASQIAELQAGQLWVNIPGEISGQILPVPEPSSWALMAMGAVLVTCRRRKSLRPAP